MLLASLGAAGDARADQFGLILNDPTDVTELTDNCDRPVCSSLLTLINGAKSKIDFAFYGIRNQRALVAALAAARARGVEVRGVVDMDANNQNYYSSTQQVMALIPGIQTDYAVDFANKQNRKAFDTKAFQCPRPAGFAGPLQCNVFDFGEKCFLIPQAAKEPIVFQGDIMHQKFVIVDDQYLWTGSTNASDSGTGGYNANLVMLLDSPTVAGWYKREFEYMFKNGMYHKLKPPNKAMNHRISPGVFLSVYFSPQDKPITNAVLPQLRQARGSIDIGVFFLTHKKITQELINAHNRGVKVRIILDASGATNEYSKHDVLRAAGVPVKVETFGGKMHAKSAVIDGRVLIGGSMNWTSAGEGGNDENTIILNSVDHAAQYKQWFEKIWNGIDDKWLTDQPAPESQPSGISCSDGVDNDYDKLKDMEDDSCRVGYQYPPRNPGRIVAKPESGCSLDLYQADQQQ